MPLRTKSNEVIHFTSAAVAVDSNHHPLRGVDSVRLQISSMDTCRQCGSWFVADHNHKKVIELGPICASLHDMDLGLFGNGLAEGMTNHFLKRL